MCWTVQSPKRQSQEPKKYGIGAMPACIAKKVHGLVSDLALCVLPRLSDFDVRLSMSVSHFGRVWQPPQGIRRGSVGLQYG